MRYFIPGCIRASLVALAGVILLVIHPHPILSQETFPFQAEVITDNVNIRSDSTVGSKSVYTARKGDTLKVYAKAYEWYKVSLPRHVSVFVKAAFLASLDTLTARAIKDRVNIRAAAFEGSPVVGKLKKDETVIVKSQGANWCTIEPTDSCFGWIHKKFVKEIIPVAPQLREQAVMPVTPESMLNTSMVPVSVAAAVKDDSFTIEGVVKSYGRVFRRAATHKIIALDKAVYLLKGNPASLKLLVGHKIRVIGKRVFEPKERYPIIQVNRTEIVE